MSYVDDLDLCSSLGIIPFDGPAYIAGTKPRFVGTPPFETIPGFSPVMKMPAQKDEFKPKKHTDVGKALGIGLVVAGLAMAVSRLKGFKLPKVKFSKPSFDALKALPAKVSAFAKNLWTKAKGLFKKP